MNIWVLDLKGFGVEWLGWVGSLILSFEVLFQVQGEDDRWI